MKNLLTTENYICIYNKKDRKYGKIGDEKLWKSYIKK